MPHPDETITPTGRMLRLTCCVCGALAKAKKQWWNRDTGYGLCGACAVWLKAKPGYDAEEFHSYYGNEGVHWLMPEATV